MRNTTLTAALLAALLFAASPAQARPSDPWITSKTKIALLTAKDLEDRNINVDTVDGRVTLHGRVRTPEARMRAEQVAKDVDGVRSVKNLIQVVPEEREEIVKTSDDQIKDSLRKAFKEDKGLKDARIEIASVNNGVVLLRGKDITVDDHLNAVRLAYSVPGVRRVATEIEEVERDENGARRIARDMEDDVRKAPETDRERLGGDTMITTAVKMRLMADRDTPALDINVDTRDGVVTLFGVVPTQEARVAAESDAMKVKGVRRVINELQVVPSARQEKVEARDEDLMRSIKRALDADDRLRDEDIRVTVRDGVARLTGTVTSEDDRLEATTTARRVKGVRSVDEDLKVKASREEKQPAVK
ncbi:MAG: BON domain-containing protein [Myxococcota bacterium]